MFLVRMYKENRSLAMTLVNCAATAFCAAAAAAQVTSVIANERFTQNCTVTGSPSTNESELTDLA